jgi:hypothetical protein
VKVGTQNRMYLSSNRNTMAFLKAPVLQHQMTGFRAGHEYLLKVRYVDHLKTVYHRYEGGDVWMATVPNELARPGQNLTIDISILTQNDFVNGIPEFSLANEAQFTWLPLAVNVSNFSLDSGFHFDSDQEPSVEGINRFRINGIPSDLGFVPGYGCYLQFRIVDFFNRIETIRVYHDGHNQPWFGLKRSRKFPRISFVSHDGARLKFVYGSPHKSVATIYAIDPSNLYKIEVESRSPRISQEIRWASDSYGVELRRDFERRMLQSAYRYPHGRIGAEIAYSIATKEIGIGDLVLGDPSNGGPDMVTRDGRTVIEARLVAITEALKDTSKTRQIDFQSARLESRLKSDLAFYPSARSGYAFLSYLDHGNIHTLVFRQEKSD